jgi:hypothetical protein
MFNYCNYFDYQAKTCVSPDYRTVSTPVIISVLWQNMDFLLNNNKCSCFDVIIRQQLYHQQRFIHNSSLALTHTHTHTHTHVLSCLNKCVGGCACIGHSIQHRSQGIAPRVQPFAQQLPFTLAKYTIRRSARNKNENHWSIYIYIYA